MICRALCSTYYVMWWHKLDKNSTLSWYIYIYIDSHLYYTILYYTILYDTIRYYTILYCTIPYHTIPYYTKPYHTISYHTIPYYTILYYAAIRLISNVIHDICPCRHFSVPICSGLRAIRVLRASSSAWRLTCRHWLISGLLQFLSWRHLFVSIYCSKI